MAPDGDGSSDGGSGTSGAGGPEDPGTEDDHTDATETSVAGQADGATPGGNSGDATADGGTGERQWTYWVRWPEMSDEEVADYARPLPTGDIHIHRVCRLLPSRGFKEDGGPENFEFISGTPRWLLRHTPLVVTVTAIVFAVAAELSPEVQGLSAIVSVVAPENALLGLGALAPWPILAWLLASVGILDFRDVSKALVVYGVGLLLLVGTAFSFLLVWTTEDPSTIPDNIVFTSGWLLTLFIGGHLLYEGMLKIEYLFANLGEREIVKNEDAYAEFLASMNDALRRDFLQDDLATILPGRAGERIREVGEGTIPVPSSHVFAVLFAGQFGAAWALRDGPQNLGFAVTLVGNVALDLIIVVAAFQFLIVIAYFNRLLNNDFVSSAGERVNLTSEPFHFDGRAGFRDLGRFAIQINLILILAGLYCVYRLYVTGGRVLGTEGISGLGGLDLLLWVFNYLVPVFALALAAGAWIYYSYWAMHEKMERDRKNLCLQYQGTRRDRDGEVPAVGDPMDSFESGPDWTYIQSTPTWPLDNQQLVSMVSGTLSPVLFVLPSLL